MTITQATVTTDTRADAPSRTATIAAALLLGLFGLSLVWGAGFANAAVLHNGAHDSRHSLVFPCH